MGELEQQVLELELEVITLQIICKQEFHSSGYYNSKRPDEWKYQESGKMILMCMFLAFCL